MCAMVHSPHRGVVSEPLSTLGPGPGSRASAASPGRGTWGPNPAAGHPGSLAVITSCRYRVPAGHRVKVAQPEPEAAGRVVRLDDQPGGRGDGRGGRGRGGGHRAPARRAGAAVDFIFSAEHLSEKEEVMRNVDLILDGIAA